MNDGPRGLPRALGIGMAAVFGLFVFAGLAYI